MLSKISKFLHLKWKFIILIILTVSNYWFWQIINFNIILSFALLIIELILFRAVIQKSDRKNMRVLSFVVIFILLVSGGILIKKNIDKNLFVNSPTEVSLYNQRHGYFSEGLGFIFNNKVTQHYYTDLDRGLGKYATNVSYVIDPNLYFFRSHPREKAGIDEYDKYSPFVLPLFIIGTLILIANFKEYLLLILYFVLSVLITGFITPGFKLGPVLMFPFVNIILYLGFVKTVQVIKYLFKK